MTHYGFPDRISGSGRIGSHYVTCFCETPADQRMCPCRVQLAPFFPSVAPGNLGKPPLHALPSRAQAGQLPTLLGRMAASGSHANGHAASSAKQVQEVHLCIFG